MSTRHLVSPLLPPFERESSDKPIHLTLTTKKKRVENSSASCNREKTADRVFRHRFPRKPKKEENNQNNKTR
jgi:hypothetical protein